MATTSASAPPEFGQRHRLALALEHAGMKPAEMARRLGVHENTVRNYLKGRAISRPVLIAWSSICEVPLEWLEQGISGFGWAPRTSAAA